MAYLEKVWRRVLSSAKITQGPDRIPRHGEAGGLGQEGEEGGEDALVQDVVPTLGGVARNVAQGPDCLLLHILLLAQEQRDEDGHGTGVDDLPGLLTGAAGDVGQGPGRLKLEHSIVCCAEELDKAGNYSGLNHLKWGKRVKVNLMALINQVLSK